MKKLVLIFALLFLVATTVGCFQIVPSISSEEIEAVQIGIEPVFDEYRQYVENDPDLDGFDKEIRLESPTSVEQLLDQMYENAKTVEDDGYVVEHENE